MSITTHIDPSQVPKQIHVNLKDFFEMMKGELTVLDPQLEVFTFNVRNLHTLGDQLIYAALDSISGKPDSVGFYNAIDILVRNGVPTEAAHRFSIEQIQRILILIQAKFAFPITNSGIEFRPTNVKYHYLELERL